ncbi:glycoside hydrolase family 99-like domain-containing protein [Sediminicoccus sp. KRV36]|uniref:glycoside hydrolase family 99-like domain-containing protein n=1 Tax=Sediminicoccus sp. KRV36 TaxID=3133721 RepID=UPI00200E34CF|nr:glycoside hydrolase family 99-like domain-containing protein [Sediminicoccus rosea]UPY36023.1 glycoside hydrolase family 99-like domain-containing protein [Sediminicoccus rosea]
MTNWKNGIGYQVPRGVLAAVTRLTESGLLFPSALAPSWLDRKIYPEEILHRYASLDADDAIKIAPFFDADHYRQQAGSMLAPDQNALLHFLQIGLMHLLSPHPLIEPSWMVKQRPALFADGIDARTFAEVMCRDVCDVSPMLHHVWYRFKHDVQQDIPVLVHYLSEGLAQNLPPNPFVNPAQYAARYADAPRSGFKLVQHIMTVGDAEGRTPGEGFDPEWYGKRYLGSGVTSGTLNFFLRHGISHGHSPREVRSDGATPEVRAYPTADVLRTEDGIAMQQRATRLRAAIYRRQRRRLEAFVERSVLPVSITDHAAAISDLSFACSNPIIDIIIPVHNEFELTVECLLALQRAKGIIPVRIILADDCSTDPRIELLRSVPGLLYLSNPINLHFLRSCNAAFQFVTAPYLLLLNNDTQLLPGCLQALLKAIQEDPLAGAAAPMMLYPNGRLQEAGCTIRRNGETTMIGLGDDPKRAGYCIARQVDYGSAACLLVRVEALGGQLFDERYVPAYCEDVDLCLRLATAGWKTLYMPSARVVHHLSVSTSKASQRRRVQLAYRNQQKLNAKWGERLATMSHVRVLAFYLPQFHPIAPNDIWWGKGFTEWTNVSRALPSFHGHYQPHLPADLGYYDLRLTEVMGEQQALARRYGIEGFVVYYYNFGATRVLEQPMEALLRRPDVDFRFALCWANENWTKHWDGGTREMLLEQSYDDATLDSVIADMVRFARDPRAIQVDGKPLVMVYRPLLLPDAPEFALRLRRQFADAGFPGVHLAYVESMEALEKQVAPADLGFDACIEFPPQGIAVPYQRPVSVSKRDWSGRVFDYAATVENATDREAVAYARYPSVFPSWDNTARQPLAGTILHDAEPELFGVYVEAKIEQALEQFTGDQRLLFVNAWNEWAEGAHLEPDRAFGHRWLTALRGAMIAKGVA